MLQVIQFLAIPFTPEIMPSIVEKLSTDEMYLFEIANAISTGECSYRLANKLPGPLNHASKKLVDIVTYIMKVYVPTYFNIKFDKSCTRGSIHFFNLIKYSNYLTPKYREVMLNVCRNNFYFAHPENILLAMIFDDDVNTRKMAYEIILKCRATHIENEMVREYVAPKFNFDEIHSKKYFDIIDWNFKTTESPFTRKITLEQIRHLYQTGENHRM